MIEDDFYAHIKLITGEELFARVSASEEEDRTMLLLSNPVTLNEIRAPGTEVPMGYRLEPWIKFGEEDLYMITMDRVITMSEAKDAECIGMYEQFVHKNHEKIKRKNMGTNPKMSREMGYVGSVKAARKHLEKMFKLKYSKNTEES